MNRYNLINHYLSTSFLCSCSITFSWTLANECHFSIESIRFFHPESDLRQFAEKKYFFWKLHYKTIMFQIKVHLRHNKINVYPKIFKTKKNCTFLTKSCFFYCVDHFKDTFELHHLILRCLKYISKFFQADRSIFWHDIKSKLYTGSNWPRVFLLFLLIEKNRCVLRGLSMQIEHLIFSQSRFLKFYIFITLDQW